MDTGHIFYNFSAIHDGPLAEHMDALSKRRRFVMHRNAPGRAVYGPIILVAREPTM
jgi:hypothetical protein